jgi:thiamine biosynthesis lipoprotein
MLRRRFHAMGTEMELVLDASPGLEALRAIAAAEQEIRRLERLLSRFDRGSELSRLNARGAMEVGAELLALVELALAAREQTGGRFDPTVHDALVTAGYDRSFDRLEADERHEPSGPVRCGGGVHVEAAASRISLEPGVRLDLGGLAKGYAADRAAAILEDAGDCLVDAGGDIAVCGGPWPIGVETAGGMLTLELADGAIATSGRDRRRWMHNGAEQHHLIDPSTGRPAAGGLLRVTVVATRAAEAEVLAKELFLAGVPAAALQADTRGLPAVLVTDAGETLLAGGLA